MVAAAIAMDEKMKEAVITGGAQISLEPGQLLYLPPLVVVWERCDSPASFINYKWVPGASDDLRATIKAAFELDGWPDNDVLSRCRSNMQIMADAWKVK